MGTRHGPDRAVSRSDLTVAGYRYSASGSATNRDRATSDESREVSWAASVGPQNLGDTSVRLYLRRPPALAMASSLDSR